MKRNLPMVLIALAAFGGAASAQVGGIVPNCEDNYKDAWAKVSQDAVKELTGVQLAQLSRYALRAYDGCTSGDERSTARDFFGKLKTVRAATADAFLREAERSLPAKK